MKTFAVIALWLAATCTIYASDPARFWSAAGHGRRSAWVVTERGSCNCASGTCSQGTCTTGNCAAGVCPTPQAAPAAAKSCPCSGQCVCGCNAGQACNCGNAAAPQAQPVPVAAPPVYYYQPSFSSGAFSGRTCRGGS